MNQKHNLVYISQTGIYVDGSSFLEFQTQAPALLEEAKGKLIGKEEIFDYKAARQVYVQTPNLNMSKEESKALQDKLVELKIRAIDYGLEGIVNQADMLLGVSHFVIAKKGYEALGYGTPNTPRDPSAKEDTDVFSAFSSAYNALTHFKNSFQTQEEKEMRQRLLRSLLTDQYIVSVGIAGRFYGQGHKKLEQVDGTKEGISVAQEGLHLIKKAIAWYKTSLNLIDLCIREGVTYPTKKEQESSQYELRSAQEIIEIWQNAINLEVFESLLESASFLRAIRVADAFLKWSNKTIQRGDELRAEFQLGPKADEKTEQITTRIEDLVLHAWYLDGTKYANKAFDLYSKAAKQLLQASETSAEENPLWEPIQTAMVGRAEAALANARAFYGIVLSGYNSKAKQPKQFFELGNLEAITRQFSAAEEVCKKAQRYIKSPDKALQISKSLEQLRMARSEAHIDVGGYAETIGRTMIEKGSDDDKRQGLATLDIALRLYAAALNSGSILPKSRDSSIVVLREKIIDTATYAASVAEQLNNPQLASMYRQTRREFGL